MKNIIATAILVSACATTGRSLPTEPSASGIAPTFDSRLATTQSPDTVQAWFPALVSDAALPSASRYQRELSTSRDRFALDVRVCVAPDGSVASVDIKQPSGVAHLDTAAAHDIARWRFESFTAPSHIRVCKQLELAYEPAAEMSALRIPLVRTSQP